MYKLIIEDDEGKTTVVPLIRDEITIGRKEGNTIRLTERNVSRKHAKLIKQNTSIYIEDLTSYNGIKINGDRISGRAPVNEGDRIQIGDYQLALKLDKATQASGGVPTAAEPVEKTMPFMKENGAGSPQSALDLAPTLQNPAVPVVAGPPPIPGLDTGARLVVVSSNFAGQEFVLDKTAMVIGRTDENDVVINHRSISRHHAKIVRENGHHHIVDLQSANGVRVNGEEYGKVELRRGDHIDLGHVRLRFVAPGEDFQFERDAQIVDVEGGRRSRTTVWIGGLAVLLLLFGAAMAWIRIGGAGGVAHPGDLPRPSSDTEAQVARLLMAAEQAMKQEEWDSAIARCDQALKLDPTLDLVRDKRQKAEAERKNAVAYQNFLRAAERHDYDGAVASYGEVAEDSVYRQKGADRYAQVKLAFLRNHIEAARRAKLASRCDEARQHVEAALTVDETNIEAQELLKGCGVAPRPIVHQLAPPQKTREKERAPVVTPSKVKPKEKEPVEKPEEGDKEPAATGAQSPAIDRILTEAQQAYVNGQYRVAIDQAHRAAKPPSSKEQSSKAWGIIGLSNCFLKDRSGAMQAWNRLDAHTRQTLQYVCAKNQVSVP